MYNRYIRNEQGAYSRIPQQEPAPGPVSGRPPPPPPSEPPPPPPGGDSSPGSPPGGPFREEADEEVLIAIGLLLIL